MRVVVNAVSAKSGGAATYLRNLIPSLSGFCQDLECIVFVPPGVLPDDSEKPGNVTIRETRAGSGPAWRRWLWDQTLLRRELKRYNADVLISSSDFGTFAPPCRQVLLIRNGLLFSPLYHHRVLRHKGWRTRLNCGIRRCLVRLSAHWSDLVVTASESMLHDVRRFIDLPDTKAVVNPFGVPVERFRALASSAARAGGDAACRVLHVGEYSDYKNLTTLLQAVRLLTVEGGANIRVTTTADPGQFPGVEVLTRELDRSLAADPLVKPVVSFAGSIDYDSVQTLYAGADVFVFPSLAESFGHPLVEAMAAALPVIASDLPIHREICGPAALYFPAQDAGELARMIRLLAGDPERRRRMGRMGQERAAAKFEWSEHVRRLLELLRRLVAAPPRSSCVATTAGKAIVG